jgi:hypothetical protein
MNELLQADASTLLESTTLAESAPFNEGSHSMSGSIRIGAEILPENPLAIRYV